jgi:hypothetical protein
LPADQIHANQDEKQAGQKKQVEQGAHDWLFLPVARLGQFHEPCCVDRKLWAWLVSQAD